VEHRVFILAAGLILSTVPVQLWIRHRAKADGAAASADALGWTAIATVGVALIVGLYGTWAQWLGRAITVLALVFLYRARRRDSSQASRPD
jgi:O-antigen/teichoic acid export membrane protein